MHFLSKQAALPQKGKNRMKGKNIVLIGMPGCGKSTVGVVLAKTMGYRFTDADLVIQEQEPYQCGAFTEENRDCHRRQRRLWTGSHAALS